MCLSVFPFVFLRFKPTSFHWTILNRLIGCVYVCVCAAYRKLKQHLSMPIFHLLFLSVQMDKVVVMMCDIKTSLPVCISFLLDSYARSRTVKKWLQPLSVDSILSLFVGWFILFHVTFNSVVLCLVHSPSFQLHPFFALTNF